MLYNDLITLLSQVKGYDSDGYETVTETNKVVYADAETSTRAEFYEGQKAGLDVKMQFTVCYADYNGETELLYNGKRYRVVRTYATDKDHIQLNCSEAVR